MSPSPYAIWCDGRLLVGDDAVLPARHPGCTSGAGVFETFRATGRGVQGFDAHLQRLRWAAGRMGYPALPVLDYLAICSELLNAVDLTEGRVRMTAYPEGLEPRVMLSIEPVDASLAARRAAGIRLLSSPFRIGERDPSRAMKLVSRAFYSLSETVVRERGGDEPLLLGDHGEIRETSRANLFAHKEGEGLLTPTLVDAFLPGVTRARLLRAARQAGIAVRERTILLEELAGCQEVFLTNAVAGAYPVVAVDDMEFEKGPVLERCLQLLGDQGA